MARYITRYTLRRFDWGQRAKVDRLAAAARRLGAWYRGPKRQRPALLPGAR